MIQISCSMLSYLFVKIILRLQRSMLSKRLKRGVISAQPIGSKQNSKSVNSQGIGKKIQMDSIVISKKAM